MQGRKQGETAVLLSVGVTRPTDQYGQQHGRRTRRTEVETALRDRLGQEIPAVAPSGRISTKAIRNRSTFGTTGTRIRATSTTRTPVTSAALVIQK
ncbi:hypothetical protein Saso_61980 [Streptomyces asoensis]|uniref:Uncharacterized protein n=1 Tax=Streptomyces asoensis TaxID=249586 RepID=A0ABQ3S8U6_9ACTN|nr:hypothetical protein GCM10010496_40170 [Streptomyces asoensis]GHI64548.1 hypothetical protein Saso_61980 [Streptomyces asoensis]